MYTPLPLLYTRSIKILRGCLITIRRKAQSLSLAFRAPYKLNITYCSCLFPVLASLVWSMVCLNHVFSDLCCWPILLLRMFFILYSSSFRKISLKPTHHCSFYCSLHKVPLSNNSSFMGTAYHLILAWFLMDGIFFLSFFLSRLNTSVLHK